MGYWTPMGIEPRDYDDDRRIKTLTPLAVFHTPFHFLRFNSTDAFIK